MPIPSSVVRQDQPAAFDLLQHGVKALDNTLQAMANVTELIDDVDEADKRSDNDKYLDRRYRKAQAYGPGPTADNGARQERNATEAPGRLSQGLARAGALARPLAGGRRQGLTSLPRPNSAPVKSRGFSLPLRLQLGLSGGVNNVTGSVIRALV
jgi:hypothetical protein